MGFREHYTTGSEGAGDESLNAGGRERDAGETTRGGQATRGRRPSGGRAIEQRLRGQPVAFERARQVFERGLRATQRVEHVASGSGHQPGQFCKKNAAREGVRE